MVNHSLCAHQLPSHDFRVWIGGSPDAPSQSVSPCTSPPRERVQHLGDELWRAVGQRHPGAEPGCPKGGFAHDTGEGSISQHHRVHGGDLIWEIGSGYFGCRNPDGTFSESVLSANATDPQVKMIELKLSQGAKPGHGGVLPAPRSRRDRGRTRCERGARP